MIILTIRTDKPEAEIGLYDGQEQLQYMVWEGHRQLAETLHTKIREVLENNNTAMSNINGIVVFKGPGSFTGLRIGMTVANTLAYSLDIPIVSETDAWIEKGIARLLLGENEQVSLPEYGAPVHITKPIK